MDRVYFPTNQKIAVQNYPYGSMRTQATFGLEHKAGKGFRTTFQTINPKTGRINAVKKSTYSAIIVMYSEESTGHIKYQHLDFYDDKRKDQAFEFLSKHFDLFTPEEIKDIAGNALMMLKVDIHSKRTYCNAPLDKLVPLYDEAIKKLVEIIKSNGTLNYFQNIVIDWPAIEALEDKDFKPFVSVNYGSITSPDFGKNPIIERY